MLVLKLLHCPCCWSLSGGFVSPHSTPFVRFGKLPVSVWGFFLPWKAVDEAKMFCTSFIWCCSSATTPGVPWGASLRWFHSKLEGGAALRVLRWAVPSWRGSNNSLRAISNSSSCSCVSLSHLFQANHHRGRGTESQRAECDVH